MADTPEQSGKKQSQPGQAAPQQKKKEIAAGADSLRLETIFPDISTIFRPTPKTQSLLADCIYVLDTSALLSPFDGGKETLAAVKKILVKLVKEDRIFIPEQSAREYVNRRRTKFESIYDSLVKQKNRTITVGSVDIRMLQAASKHAELSNKIKTITKAVEDYRKTLGELLAEMREWAWDDPVTRLYREVFDAKHFVTYAIARDELQKDFKSRFDLERPPGYEDADKTEGIGDLAIWHTIIAIGNKAKRNVVFVTTDKKADWMCSSGDEVLSVRHELCDEYYRATNKDFGIVDYVEFLKVNGATDEAINEAREAALLAMTTRLGQWLGRHLKTAVDANKGLLTAGMLRGIASAIDNLDEIQDICKTLAKETGAPTFQRDVAKHHARFSELITILTLQMSGLQSVSERTAEESTTLLDVGRKIVASQQELLAAPETEIPSRLPRFLEKAYVLFDTLADRWIASHAKLLV